MSAASETTASSDSPAGQTAGLHRYADSIESITEQLHGHGAMAVVVVTLAEIVDIESSYGVETYEHVLENLVQSIAETCAVHLEGNDRIVTGEIGGDEIFIFFFRPRNDDAFYRETLFDIVGSLNEKFTSPENRFAYPYRRDPPPLPVGSGLGIYNPGISQERQVRETLDRARRDAHFNEEIASRSRAKRFVDLVLAEDVTALYEPIVNVNTRETIGFEALTRGPWDSEFHAPDALFGMAEKTDLVFELDCLCRRNALRGARGLMPGKKLFLNCLPGAIHDPAFRGDVLRKTLEDLRLRPSDVVFEISEKESIRNFEIFREARDYYGELGFKVALDDPGVAYGSLEAIMELSPDFIKMDLTLVRGIDTDPPRQELLRALNSVAATINASVIAEGLETSEELATIKSLGIHYGQGYLFGRPAVLRRSV